MGTTSEVLNPIALGLEEGEALWAFGTLATIKASAGTTGGKMALVEHLAPQGAGSPLHIHHNEDEWFFITEGEVTFWVGGRVIEAGVGSFVYGPREIPHTFEVKSEQARFLLGTEPAGFENFMRLASEPATKRTLPPTELPPVSMERIMAAAKEYGIEIIGPPGIPN